jgi:hypothetical protein
MRLIWNTFPSACRSVARKRPAKMIGVRVLISRAFHFFSTQDGRLKTIGEFVAAQLPAYEFAREVVNRFVLPPIQGQRRRIVAIYLDPSNLPCGRNRGDVVTCCHIFGGCTTARFTSGTTIG